MNVFEGMTSYLTPELGAKIPWVYKAAKLKIINLCTTMH